jgi:acyl-CoA reductase-like NAD-dependent aldehyde dehydrogenase
LSTTPKFADAPVKSPGRLFIDGGWIAPSSDATIEVRSAISEELFLTVAEALEADVNRAVDAARRAFDTGPWPRMSPAERAGHVRALGQALSRRVPEVAGIWPHEMGNLHSWSLGGAQMAAGFYEDYARIAEGFVFEEEHPTDTAKVGMLAHEAVGVVGAIIPWNGSPIISAVKVAPALVAGCTIVIKASPQAPGVLLLLAEAAEECGIPPGVINVLTARRSGAGALINHPGVDKIAFTGSTSLGRHIASTLGQRIGRYTLELGGKGAAVILDDYDLQTAADVLAPASCSMSGQMCGLMSRIIVSRNRHDALVEALVAGISKVKVGDPFASDTGMGPVATEAQRQIVMGYIAGAKADGFKLAFGGGVPAGLDRGYYVEPTVFAGVDNSSTLAQEEVFGPVIAVIPADDEAHAVRLANDSIYGLSNAVFTNDAQRAYGVAREMRAGNICHNTVNADFSICFGGFKQSGIGREGGIEGLRPYLEAKTMLLQGRPRQLG